LEENELMELNLQQIVVTIGKVEFPDFEPLKNQAYELADHIANVEVDPENIKQSKKLVAEVSKRLKELEDRRITIKKLMLEPYNDFEAKVKEIVAIVREAEDTVRMQVRALEEVERREKQSLLESIFNKRIVHYTFRDFFSFADFFKPKHLNKTVSVDAVEKEMIEFLERLAKDFNIISKMQNSEQVFHHYRQSLDLATALTLVREIEQTKGQDHEKSVLYQH
jgi:hypothetical protein